MFAIGEARARVNLSKLELPKEYHLKGKNLFGLWSGKRKLYLSDERKVLEAKSGRNETVFEFRIDSSSRIQVPSVFNKKEAVMKGRIWNIEIEFEE